MNCRKARSEIFRADSPELKEHILSCPKCARLAHAQEVIESALAGEREKQNVESTPFGHLRSKISAKNESFKGGLMETLRDRVESHPKFSLGLATIAAIVIFAVIIPLPYQTTVGYEVKFKAPDADAAESIGELSKALDAIGYAQAEIDASLADSQLQYTISNLPTLEDAREVSAAVEALSADLDKLSLEIAAVEASANATLLAQVHDKLFDIDVDEKGKTDQEIEAEIRAKLAAQGITNGKVDVSTDTSGNRNITISVDSLSDSSRQKQIEKIQIETHNGDTLNSKNERKQIKKIEIERRGDNTVINEGDLDKNLQKIEIETKSNDPKEIEAEIRKKLSAEGHPDADVKVQVESDSTRKIEIEVRDTTGQ